MNTRSVNSFAISTVPSWLSGAGAAPFPDDWLKADGDDGLRDFMYRDEYRLRDRQSGKPE